MNEPKSVGPEWRGQGRRLWPVVTLSAILIEVLAYAWGGAMAGLAGALWLAFGGFYFANSAVQLKRAFELDWRAGGMQRGLVLAGLSFTIWLCFRGIVSDQVSFNVEASLQISEGLKFFRRSDLGYTSFGFLGYPGRQYLLVALPSWLGGLSALNFKLGMGLPFFSGLWMFYAGLRNAVFVGRNHALWPLIAVLGVMTFPFCGDVYGTFEQSILPLSFCLHATGWFLLVRQQRTTGSLLCLVWIGGLLGCSYTPALAAWGLLLVALGYLIFMERVHHRSRQDALSLSCAFVMIAGFGLLSFWTRHDFFHEGSHVLRQASLEKDVSSGLRMLVWDQNKPFFPVELLLPVLAYAIWAGLGRGRLVNLGILAWTVTVVVSAVTLKGYVPREPSVDLHRALVLLPPLIAAMVLAGSELVEKRKLSRLIISAVVAGSLLVLAHRGWRVFSPDTWRLLRPQDRVIQALVAEQTLVAESGRDIRLVALCANLEGESIWDLTAYFFPNARLVFFDEKAPLEIRPDEWQAGLIYLDKRRAPNLAALVQGEKTPGLLSNETETSLIYALNESSGLVERKKAAVRLTALFQRRILKAEQRLHDALNSRSGSNFAIGDEIDDSYLLASPAALRRAFVERMVDEFVVNTQWSWGNGSISLIEGGMLNSTWGNGTWEILKNGTVVAVFPAKDFRHVLRFSADMNAIEVTRHDGAKMDAQFMRALPLARKKIRP